MDLHDYKDVAENYDLYLDVMYKDVDNHSGFKDFYLDFAKEYGKDGVIDIACGTGSVLIGICEAIIYVGTAFRYVSKSRSFCGNL